MITRLALLAALLLSSPGPVQTPEATLAPSVPQQLTVLLADRQGEAPKTVQPGDLQVVDGGAPRPAVSLAPVSQPWRIVVWVDRVLTGSRTLRAAAGTLAEQAQALAALGTVEVVVAEPQPRVALAPTREVKDIDEALSKLWLGNEGRDDLRVLRQRFKDEKAEGADAEGRIAEAVEAEARVVRRQQDAFSEWLLAQKDRGEGPRAVFLVSDGYDTDPGQFYHGVSSPEGALEKSALEAARVAAALGWTVYPLPVGNATLPDLRKVQPHGSGDPKAPIGVTINRGKPAEGAPSLPALVSPQQPLTWMAEATGGDLVLQPSGIFSVLSRLRSRYWLRWEAPRGTDGQPRPLEVVTSRSDLTVKARRWDVTGVPESMAAARAGRLLSGEEEGVGIEISARVQADAGGSADSPRGTLDLRVESDPPPPGPLRLTLAGPGGRGAFHHLLRPAERGPEPNVYHLPVPLPAGAEAVGVLVEAAGGSWGGVVATLTAAAPEPAAVSVAKPGIRLVAPSGTALTGKVRLRVNGEGEGIARVALKLGERTVASCDKVPCEAEVDLGRRAHPQIVQGVAYDAAGQELARDFVRVNDPAVDFGVRIVEPAGRRGVGAVDVEADVRAPAGRRIEKVEMYWNDELAATLYAPPFRHKVMVPRDRSVGYLKVTARLDDGSTAEDAMPLNASDLGDRIDVRLVQLAVVVTDASGKPVPGLPKEAFRLRQDGQEQEIAAFENAGELPLTLALAIDTSASMFMKLPDVRKAVASLLNTGLTSRDRAMLIDFDTKPKVVRPLTRDLASVVSALDQLQPDGGTALWDAVTYSLAQLRGITGRKALVVYSDGIDEAERATFPICLKAARGSGVPIYLIVSNPRAERGEDGGFMNEPSSVKFQKLAGAGGGQVYFIHPSQDLNLVYGQILSELRSQYTVAFYPKDTSPPAAWTKIEVEVQGRKGLTARTVSGVAARP